MADYPKMKYHAEIDPVVIASEEEETDLGEDWKDSPADHGVITNPDVNQARKIKQDALEKEEKRKPGRPKKED